MVVKIRTHTCFSINETFVANNCRFILISEEFGSLEVSPIKVNGGVPMGIRGKIVPTATMNVNDAHACAHVTTTRREPLTRAEADASPITAQ